MVNAWERPMFCWWQESSFLPFWKLGHLFPKMPTIIHSISCSLFYYFTTRHRHFFNLEAYFSKKNAISNLFKNENEDLEINFVFLYCSYLFLAIYTLIMERILRQSSLLAGHGFWQPWFLARICCLVIKVSRSMSTSAATSGENFYKKQELIAKTDSSIERNAYRPLMEYQL